MTQRRKCGPRHESRCSVCLHPLRAEIDEAFVNWMGPRRIARKYHISPDALYRHANATNLMDRRQRNVRAALERIIEHATEVKPNAATVVSAVATYARLNSRGELVERTQMHTVNMNELFQRMTKEEMVVYARTSALPEWFLTAVGTDNQGDPNGR
jgi:hypothetical protein